MICFLAHEARLITEVSLDAAPRLGPPTSYVNVFLDPGLFQKHTVSYEFADYLFSVKTFKKYLLFVFLEQSAPCDQNHTHVSIMFSRHIVTIERSYRRRLQPKKDCNFCKNVITSLESNI